MSATLHHGDALDVLSSLPSGSARCCVTSPPYWGLRSYHETAVRIDPKLEPAIHQWVIDELGRRGIDARL